MTQSIDDVIATLPRRLQRFIRAIGAEKAGIETLGPILQPLLFMGGGMLSEMPDEDVTEILSAIRKACEVALE